MPSLHYITLAMIFKSSSTRAPDQRQIAGGLGLHVGAETTCELKLRRQETSVAAFRHEYKWPWKKIWWSCGRSIHAFPMYKAPHFTARSKRRPERLIGDFT